MPELEEISEMYDEKDLKIIGLPGDLYGADGVVDEDQVAKALDIIITARNNLLDVLSLTLSRGHESFNTI